MIFGYSDPNRQSSFTRTSEPLSVRFRKFLKTQPVLALLLAQSITLYVLLHPGFFYGLLFVLLLYFGGLFLRQYFSDLTLIVVYLSGGIAGYFAYPLMFGGALAMPGKLHIAAIQGAAILALLTFTSVAKPDIRLRFLLLMAVRYWHLVAVLIIIVLLKRDMEGGGTHLCYLAGSLMAALDALIFIRKIFRIPVQKITGMRAARRWQKFSRYETIRETGRPLRDEEYNDIRAERQERIDQILDKISQSGYDSLTREEKELLFKQGK